MAGVTVVRQDASKGPQRLGETGLALHYANIINQINIIVSLRLPFPVIRSSYNWYRQPKYVLE